MVKDEGNGNGHVEGLASRLFRQRKAYEDGVFPDDDDFHVEYEGVWNVLTDRTVSPRERCLAGSLTITIKGRTFVGFLKHVGSQSSITLKANTFVGLLQQLSKDALDPATVWEVNERRQTQTRKIRKRDD